MSDYMDSGVNGMVMVDGENRNAASVCRTLQGELDTVIEAGYKWMAYTVELRAACEQKQKIINSFDVVDSARIEENAKLQAELDTANAFIHLKSNECDAVRLENAKLRNLGEAVIVRHTVEVVTQGGTTYYTLPSEALENLRNEVRKTND